MSTSQRQVFVLPVITAPWPRTGPGPVYCGVMMLKLQNSPSKALYLILHSQFCVLSLKEILHSCCASGPAQPGPAPPWNTWGAQPILSYWMNEWTNGYYETSMPWNAHWETPLQRQETLRREDLRVNVHCRLRRHERGIKPHLGKKITVKYWSWKCSLVDVWLMIRAHQSCVLSS